MLDQIWRKEDASLGSESRLAVWLLSRCREEGRVPQEKSQQRKKPAIFRK